MSTSGSQCLCQGHIRVTTHHMLRLHGEPCRQLRLDPCHSTVRRPLAPPDPQQLHEDATLDVEMEDGEMGRQRR